MLEEMQALEKKKTWEIINLPAENHAMGCKWMYTLKYNLDGTI